MTALFIIKGESVLQRPTQTAAFWRDQFEVTADDMEFLYQLLLDAQKPLKLSELAIALIDEYLRRENTRIEQDLSKGAIYVPKQRYQVGQTLVFPALEFAVGQVLEVRKGQNPEHGDFEVIKVQFWPQREAARICRRAADHAPPEPDQQRPPGA